ncbi:unnamed protein product [Durusdinium trenchii]|uniref:Uncharacterized protein n=1 Tax=Durusdinium trenchii TaxID=1381693 RepID=A0ABP0K6X0_9DINO
MPRVLSFLSLLVSLWVVGAIREATLADSLCCCYKELKVYAGICVKDGKVYEPIKNSKKENLDFTNHTFEYDAWWMQFIPEEKKTYKRRMHLQLRDLGTLDQAETAEIQFYGFEYRKRNDKKHVSAKELFDNHKDYGKTYGVEEATVDGHPIFSYCGSDELEPINYFQLVDGQSTNKKPSKCFQKSDLKTRAGLSICPAKMTRFGCACDGC